MRFVLTRDPSELSARADAFIAGGADRRDDTVADERRDARPDRGARPPWPAIGALRVVRARERELAVAWMRAFIIEAEAGRGPGEAERLVYERFGDWDEHVFELAGYAAAF